MFLAHSQSSHPVERQYHMSEAKPTAVLKLVLITQNDTYISDEDKYMQFLFFKRN